MEQLKYLPSLIKLRAVVHCPLRRRSAMSWKKADAVAVVKGKAPRRSEIAKPLPIALGIALAITGIAINPALAQVTRFHFEIDPKTPLKELLPVAPEMKTPVKPLAIDDLFEVPEVHVQDPNILPGGDLAKARKLVAHQIAKINFLNDKGPDQFVK